MTGRIVALRRTAASAGGRIAATALAMLVLSDAGATQSGQEFGIAGEPEVMALLKQARAHLAAPTRIGAVKGFRVEGVQIRGDRDTDRTPFKYSILFPNAFRSESEIVTTVLAGSVYWREFHKQLPFWNPTAEEQQQVRQRTLRGFVEACLAVLLRAPEPAVVEAKLGGRKAIGSLTGDVVEFVIKGVGSVEYVFDPKTRQALGFATRGRMAGGDPAQQTLRVERFTRFEQVSGIRVPVESEEVFSGAALSDKPQRIERIITVDPPLGPKDFERPAKVP